MALQAQTEVTTPPFGARERANRSVLQLGGDFTRELAELIHHEMQLAALEANDKGRRAGRGVAVLGVAAVMAAVGVACLAAAAVAALSLVLPVWLGAVCTAAALLLCAAAAGLIGRAQMRRAAPPLPTEALKSSKESLAWLNQQAKCARR